MDEVNNIMLNAALDYVKKGFFVFPCREKPGAPYQNKDNETIIPEEKTPYTSRGLNDATIDEDQIRAWWGCWPNALIGVNAGKSGLFVVDIDVKHVNGLDTYSKWGIDDSAGFQSITPSGGMHIIFTGAGKSSTNAETGIDTRGEGGYFIAPHSKILEGEHPGEYKALNDWNRTPGNIPDGLLKKLFPNNGNTTSNTQKEGKNTPSKKTLEFITFGAEPGERNTRLSKALFDFAGCGYSPDEARETFSPIVGKIGLSDSEFAQVLKSAYSKPRMASCERYLLEEPPFDYPINQNVDYMIGNDTEIPEMPDDFAQSPYNWTSGSVSYTDETFKNTPIEDNPTASKRFNLRTLKDIDDNRPPKKFIVEGMIREKSLNMIAGAYGHRKTWLVYSMAVCVAAGKKWAGMQTVQSTVLIINEETDKDDLDYRLDAAIKGERLTRDIPVYSLSLSFFNFFKGLEEHRDSGTFYFNQDLQRLEDFILQTGAKLVIIDAYRDVMAGYKENTQEDNIPVLNALRQVCIRTGCAILILHHFNRSGTFAGNAGIMQCLETGINVKSPPEGHLIELKSEKVRNTAFMKKTLRMHEIVDEDDPSIVVSYVITEENKKPFEEEKKLHINDKHIAILNYTKEHKGVLILEEYRKTIPEGEWTGYRNAIYQLRDSGKLIKDFEKSTLRKAIYIDSRNNTNLEIGDDPSQGDFLTA